MKCNRGTITALVLGLAFSLNSVEASEYKVESVEQEKAVILLPQGAT